MPRILLSCLLCALLSFGFAFPAVAGPPWVPVGCKEKPEELREWRLDVGIPASAWERYRQAVREARPGDSVFAPHPYPVQREDIVEDFLYGYFEVFFRNPDAMELEERPIYDSLKAGTIRFEVERVENWGVSRCGSDRFVSHYHLLRLFDQVGREVSRAVLPPSGLLARYGRLEASGRTFPEPKATRSILRDRYGLDLIPSDAQLVTVDGLPSPCRPENPCLAFRTQGRVWLMENGWFSNGLYEVLPDSRRLSMPAWRKQQAQRGLRLGVVDRERPLVSIGFEWAEARRVAEERVASAEEGDE